MTVVEARPYPDILNVFAKTGAELMRESIPARYGSLVDPTDRFLEPGYVPPDAPARVLIVSFYPNRTELDKPGSREYVQARERLARWAASGTVEDYRACYEHWLGELDRYPFHRKRTKPILDMAGLSASEIAWVPLVKAPLAAGTSPGAEVIDRDREATLRQLLLLRPTIVWIQGKAIEDHIMPFVKDRITECVLPAQSLSQFASAKVLEHERSRIAARLTEYLAA